MEEERGNDDQMNDQLLMNFAGGPQMPDEHDWEEEDMAPLADLLRNARELFGQNSEEDDSGNDRVLLLEPLLNALGQGASNTNSQSDSEEDKSEMMAGKEMNEHGSESPESHLNWTFLPDVVLSQLFSKLGDKDIGNASRVCKQWNKTINDPILWRVRHVMFGSSCLDGRYTKYLVGFARRHGQHVQKLRIQCPHPTYSVAKKFQSTMTSFFYIMNMRKADGRRCELKELTVNQVS